MNKTKLLISAALIFPTILLTACGQPNPTTTTVPASTNSQGTISITPNPKDNSENTQTPPVDTIPPVDNTQPTDSSSVTLDKPFTLSENQTVDYSPGKSIRFDKVLGDSRCPTGTQCIWAGEAKIQLTITGFDGDTPVTMPISTLLQVNPIGSQAPGKLYSLQLVNLLPHPDMKVVHDPAEPVVATLKLSVVQPTI